jgi:hypothetical protein
MNRKRRLETLGAISQQRLAEAVGKKAGEAAKDRVRIVRTGASQAQSATRPSSRFSPNVRSKKRELGLGGSLIVQLQTHDSSKTPRLLGLGLGEGVPAHSAYLGHTTASGHYATSFLSAQEIGEIAASTEVDGRSQMIELLCVIQSPLGAISA